ncbi:DUF2778 domain-containing protein [Sinorhizobium sp. A49]|uniref:DUF2778 domain-containing protein n=1 Tax=Sinorhizobium sp. A49 TaxID=1945861 RepID=UPI001FD937C1|nr:DUF2778 domain-containing protein [Sinorhizobium sp. A49]
MLSKIVRSQSLRRLLRPLLITCCGIALAGAAAGSVVGAVAMGSFFAHGSGNLLPKPQLYVAQRKKERSWVKQARVEQTPRLVAAVAEPVVLANVNGAEGKLPRNADIFGDAEASGKAARFSLGATQATLTSEQIVRHFKASHSITPSGAIASIDTPAPERFGPPLTRAIDKPLVSLAYAGPSKSASGSAVFSALLTAPLADEFPASKDASVEDEAVALPDYEDTPSSGPMPQFRPGGDQAQKPATEAEKPETGRARTDAAPKADERETPKQQELAFVRPNNPADNKSGGGLRALRDLFRGGSRAGNGVAVYDISAAKVYMPDGSVLEAHSGIGKMADNPRYVNVKMTGPTPPHTYNLKMRETRFHGVEAIRMLPIDGRNKHGRDGFLTHSYLLRGNRAESHGCVAFKDYPRFLTAFKQGKVRQIVVVPSGGRAAGMQMASNGKNT